MSVRLLPKIVRVFEQQHPHITTVLFEGTDQEVAGWLQDRIINVGFTAQSTPCPDMIPLTKDEMVAVLPKAIRSGTMTAYLSGHWSAIPSLCPQEAVSPLLRSGLGRLNAAPPSNLPYAIWTPS